MTDKEMLHLLNLVVTRLIEYGGINRGGYGGVSKQAFKTIYHVERMRDMILMYLEAEAKKNDA